MPGAVKDDIFDAVVIGGGPAGSAAAIFLANAGHRVQLLEKHAAAAGFKIGEMLPAAACVILRDLGVWEDFVSSPGEHLPCYGNLSAWGSGILQETDFIFDPHGHGWHLDRPLFDRFLQEQAGRAGARLRNIANIHGIEFEDGGGDPRWHLQVKTANGEKEHIRCRWLIDASGRQRIVTRSLNIPYKVVDELVGHYMLFQQSAGFAGTDNDSRTLVEACPNGWWYTSLLPQKKRLVVFMTDKDLSPFNNRENRQDRFMSLIAESRHIRELIAKYSYEIEEGPKSMAAHSGRSAKFCGNRWLAVGDAAFSCDPLSSQGILTALFTGMKAGENLGKILSGNLNAADVFEEQLESVYKAYLHNLKSFYELENRWAQELFWKRRRRPVPRPEPALFPGELPAVV